VRVTPATAQQARRARLTHPALALDAPPRGGVHVHQVRERYLASLSRPGTVSVVNGRIVEGDSRRHRRSGTKRRRNHVDQGAWDTPAQPVDEVPSVAPRPQRRVLAGERLWREVRQRAEATGWRLVREASSLDFYGEGNPILQSLLFSVNRMPVSGGGLSRYFLSESWRERDSYLNMEGNPPASTFAIENLAPLPEERVQEEDLECAICQDCFGHEEDTEGKMLPCKHAFHHKCVAAWLQQHNTCPSCRAEMESTCPKYNRQNRHKMLGMVREEAMAAEVPAQEGWRAWTAPSFMYDDELR